MKKKIALLIATLMSMVVMLGCGAESKTPSDFVNEYFAQIKKEAGSELAKEMLGAQYEDEDVPKEAVTALVDMIGKIEVTTTGEKINGDTAVVNVNVKGVSFNDIMNSFLTKILTVAMENPNISEAEAEKLVMDALVDAIKTAPMSERTGVINLKKAGDGWEVQDDTDLEKAIFGELDSKYTEMMK